MMFRCIAEISTWTSEVLNQVEIVREELMKEVKQSHAEAQVRENLVVFCLSSLIFIACSKCTCTGGRHPEGE